MTKYLETTKIQKKMVYKTKHFHEVSIITTGEHDVPNYVIEMIKFYYSTERKEKQPEPHLNRFIIFMIENKPDDMERLMIKAGCTDYDI
eukprot:339397-Amphidinium_carterae.2